MKNGINKNMFSFLWLICLIGLFILIVIGYSNSIKGTNAYFGDPSGTGSLNGEIYSVYYYRNWPNIQDTEYVQEKKYNITRIFNYEELFTLIDGYQFIGWNTLSDGSGISFDVDTTFKLTADMNLYAQWRLIVAYGDVNEDGVINEEDNLLMGKYLNGEEVLTKQGIVNADVNNDGDVNLVDVDIVKQVCLGTVGYVGFLPDKPILKYDIYEGNVDIGTDTSNDENNNIGNNNNSNNNSNVDNGIGSGNVGNGNGSSGTTQNDSLSNNNGLGSDNGTGNDDSEDTNTNGNNEDLSIDVSDNILKFKFMNGNLEYASSECLIDDGKCLLILPKDSPKIEGYKFTGWSEQKGCPDNRGILKSVYVNSDKVYYACFVDNMNWKNVYLIVIISIICLTAFMTIWNLIDEFKNKYININN